MKLTSICPNRRASKTTVKVDNRTKLQGLKTLGFIDLKSRAKGAQIEGSRTKTRVRIFKSRVGLRLAKMARSAKETIQREYIAKKAFILSLKAVSLERAIAAKKQLLKYGYSFAKTVEVAKAYLNLRQFKAGLSYSLKSLIFA